MRCTFQWLGGASYHHHVNLPIAWRWSSRGPYWACLRVEVSQIPSLENTYKLSHVLQSVTTIQKLVTTSWLDTSFLSLQWIKPHDRRRYKSHPMRCDYHRTCVQPHEVAVKLKLCKMKRVYSEHNLFNYYRRYWGPSPNLWNIRVISYPMFHIKQLSGESCFTVCKDWG